MALVRVGTNQLNTKKYYALRLVGKQYTFYPLQAIDRMKSEFQSEKDKGTEGVTQTADLTIEFMQLDLTSLNSTKTFTEQFKTSGRKLNVVVCNAGIAYAPLGNKVKNKKIPHCRNNSKIKYHNHRKRHFR